MLVALEGHGLGIGQALVEWAIARATERGCHMVELTTDKSREAVKRFYEELGSQATHEGVKLHIQTTGVDRATGSARATHVQL